MHLDEASPLSIVEASPDGILVLDFTGGVRFASPGIAALLGLADAGGLLRRHPLQFVVPEDRILALQPLRLAHEGTPQGPVPMRLVRSDGSVVCTEWNLEPMLGEGASVQGIFVSIRDAERRSQCERRLLATNQYAEAEIVRLRRMVSELQLAAWTDGLTDVGNRRRFEVVANAEIARSHRYGQPVSLVLFDIDHFKQVNDRHGHQTGDRVLVAIAHVLRRSLRACDTLCRWGGEEFVVLAPCIEAAAALRCAERIRKRTQAMCLPVVGTVSVSAGVAQLGSCESLGEWLGRADRAVYTAKRHGRNRCELATHEHFGDGRRFLPVVSDSDVEVKEEQRREEASSASLSPARVSHVKAICEHILNADPNSSPPPTREMS